MTETTVTVVTSCSLAGWHQYAAKGLATMLQLWPQEIDIHLVSEDKIPVEGLYRWIGRSNRFHVWPLHDNHEAQIFYTRHDKNNVCKGLRRAGSYDFRLDAYRFSKKVFAIQLIAKHVKQGRLIWIDSDTVTLNPVPMEMLQRMPPADFAVAYLARHKSYHSECGFVGYNLNMQPTHDFITKFAGLYSTDEVFKLREWHDSWVFDWLRNQIHLPSYSIPHNNNGHPFVYSELGKYMDHLKGARKRLGLSTEHPRFVRRKG